MFKMIMIFILMFVWMIYFFGFNKNSVVLLNNFLIKWLLLNEVFELLIWVLNNLSN